MAKNNDHQLDLNDLVNRPGMQLTITTREEPSEREARIGIERAEAEHRLWKDRTLHVVALAGIGVAFGLCIWIILREGSASEGAKWAVPLLASIVAGIVGFLFGKAAK